MSDSESDRIPTNLRNLMVLEAVADGHEGRTTSEIAQAIGLTRQTVHRLCNTLVREGFLMASDTRGCFRPGRRAREVASKVLFASSTHIARRQILENLAEQLGETINFAVPEETGMSYKERVETNWALRIQIAVGSYVPFHSTATGKVYLASLRKSQREKLVKSLTLKSYTENTITNEAALLRELSTIARRGYSTDNQELMESMIAVAVPVRDNEGRYFASLATHGPIPRIDLDNADEIAKVLHAGADRVREALFGPKET